MVDVSNLWNINLSRVYDTRDFWNQMQIDIYCMIDCGWQDSTSLLCLCWTKCRNRLASAISYWDNYSRVKYCVVLIISVQMPCCEIRVRVFVRRRTTACLKSASPVVTNFLWIGTTLSSMEQRLVLHLTFAARELWLAILRRVISMETIKTEFFSFDE